ncbi:glycosyltransferase family 4 protein [Flavihumibacter rivuli]|uniref:glycosyltransferase family 4 protein n=1 Tax=Flavihumibacter rivuli TaxID=2838156 RepID=UPI001BDF1DE0|nr:glycosyltransferase family 4 protein [Flavihumibacter rivuli]ULQ57943.1 glycosyltransferase family 4 protein [Flavihumibacter rivuli]
MKVLYVTNMYPQGENDYYGIFVKEQVEYLKENFGVEPEIYFIRGNRKYWGYWEYLKSIVVINWMLASRKYDAVHIHYGLSGLFLLLNFWYPSKRVFVTYHGGDFLIDQGRKWQVKISHALARKVGKVVAINERIYQAVKEKGLQPVLIPCGIDTDFFKPADRDQFYKNGKFTVVFPGDPARWVKNYPLFQQIVQRLRSETEIEVEEKVLVKCNRAQVREIIQQADCLLLTSFTEASPQVVKEALACNLPVIATRVGDVEKTLKGLPGCSVHDKEDQEGFVRDLAKLAESQGRKEGLRQRIFDLELDQRTVCRKVFEMYQGK